MAYFIILLVCAVLCVLYSGVVFAAGTGTAFFAVWIAIATGFVGLALGVKFKVWGMLPLPLKIIFIVVVAFCLIIFMIVEGMILSKFNSKGKENLDVIIVLGAQVGNNGPRKALKYRLDKASEYLNNNPETVCIVSGGQGSNEPFSEAYCMAEYLKQKGIDEGRIILEDKSTSTKENFEFSKQYVKSGDTVGVVTNNFHVFRALKVAKKSGYDNVYGVSAKSTLTYLPNNLLREFIGLIKYFVAGDI